MGNIIHLTETESTNQYLSTLQRKERPEEGTIVVTDFQTAGKGQTGNSWESETGKNLTFSIILYPDVIEAHEQFIISQLISLAIIDTLKPIINDVSIKWPNDIYVGDKKIAGILIENVLSGKHIESCIIGIGLNVNQEIFSSTAPNPVSLKQLTNKHFDLSILLEDIRNNIFTRYLQILNEDSATIFSEYFKNLYRKEGYHTYKTEKDTFEAKINAVLCSGQLVLETKEGKVLNFSFKEVQVKI